MEICGWPREMPNVMMWRQRSGGGLLRLLAGMALRNKVVSALVTKGDMSQFVAMKMLDVRDCEDDNAPVLLRVGGLSTTDGMSEEYTRCDGTYYLS